MNGEPGAMVRRGDTAINVIVLSQVCLFREFVGHCLAGDDGIRLLDACDGLDQARRSIMRLGPDMVLLDARFAGGPAAAAELGNAGRAQVVAVALEESENTLLGWAAAGIAGYIADTVSSRDFPQLLRQIRWGRQAVAAHIMDGLLRRVGRSAGDHQPPARETGALTPRERVIQQRIGAGLSNKAIARELNISVGTAKAHAHNILKKLNLTSRVQLAARLGGGYADRLAP